MCNGETSISFILYSWEPFALSKCGTTPDQCIMIGDNIEVDIIGAMNAGIDQVYVNHLGIDPAITPTYTVNSLKELEKIF